LAADERRGTPIKTSSFLSAFLGVPRRLIFFDSAVTRFSFDGARRGRSEKVAQSDSSAASPQQTAEVKRMLTAPIYKLSAES
jgi:hypothetical protein